MTSDRAKRIDTLARWWKDNLPAVVKRETAKSHGLWDTGYDEAIPYLLAESQKRWPIAISTARDYARVVFLTHENKFNQEVKRYKKHPRKQ